MTDQPTFERKPGAPAWEEGKEYACWLPDRSLVTVAYRSGRKWYGSGSPCRMDDGNIDFHFELPPEPPKPKRLKPGLYKLGYDACKALAVVHPHGHILHVSGGQIGADFTLPPGYEVLDAYHAGWEEGE